MNVRVLTDTGTGFNMKEAGQYNVDLLPLQVTIDGTHYLDGVDLDIDTLYDALEEGKTISTSLPPLGLIEDQMEAYQKEGVDAVVLISLSSGLSSTNSAVAASAKAHDIDLYTTDIYTTLGVERYLAQMAGAMAAQGKSAQEIIDAVDAAVADSAGYLVASDLDYLAKGGRLTPAAAKLGGLLKIKPILEVSQKSKGKVDVLDKVRTMSKAVRKATDTVLEEMADDKEYEVIILDSRNSPDADVAQAIISELRPDVHINRQPIYAVIASHTGLGAIGIQYVPKMEGEQ